VIGWYIGEIIVLVGVVPVVLILLQRLYKPIRGIKATTDDILEHAGNVSELLKAVPKLVRTRDLTAAAYKLVGRYGAAIVAILAG
jgi:uncharacterized membrane protein